MHGYTKKEKIGEVEMGFRKDFVWGTATASYQIEGAAFEDGKGLNTWDVFCNEGITCEVQGDGLDTEVNSTKSANGSSHIRNNQTGNVASDHYHHYKEDVELMAELGAKGYRFSINWSRLIPNGIGEINEKGAQFYSDLVDALLEKGIEPYVTLFHWDYPHTLEAQGGWCNPESPKWFEYYANVVATLFGERVQNYMTFNEFQCFAHLGYKSGGHAPGKQLADSELVPMAHNILLCHGLAVKAIRKVNPLAKVSMAPCGRVPLPADLSEKNIEAARKRYFSYDISNFLNSVAFWSDAAILGVYHESFLKDAEQYLPESWKDDLKNIISQPMDYYCQNQYNGYLVADDGNGGVKTVPFSDGHPHTGNAQDGWYVTPEVLYWGPKFLCDRYKLPLYITENGVSLPDCVSLDGKVHDPGRIDYINRYLLQLMKLADEGYDIRGYFVWSLMDNFGWAGGYYDRNGLIWIDYTTQERIPKDSFYWYKQVAETNGENL